MFIGIDGGGTKTITLCAQADGTVCGIGKGGCSNHESCGYEAAADTIIAAIDSALSSAGASRNALCYLHAGLSGMDWPGDCDNLHTILERKGLNCQFTLENDSFLIARAGTPNGIGIGVGAGTGYCCCILPPQGDNYFYGSFMDQGGGKDIEEMAIHAIVRAGDGRGPATTLTKIVLEAGQCATIEEFLYKRARGAGVLVSYEIIRRAVFDEATRGDTVALGIIKALACTYCDAAVHLIDKYNLKDTALPVACAGSLFTKAGPVLFKEFADALFRKAPLARCALSEQEPVLGALRAALAHAGGNVRDAWERACKTYSAFKK